MCSLLSNFFFLTFEEKYDINRSYLLLENHSFLLYFNYIESKIQFMFHYFERMESGDLAKNKEAKIIIERISFP